MGAQGQETEVPGKVLGRDDLVQCDKAVGLDKQGECQMAGCQDETCVHQQDELGDQQESTNPGNDFVNRGGIIPEEEECCCC